MNPLLIEQLVNDYLDQELPEDQTLKVEELLRTDPDAKRIHDEILSIRQEIRSFPQKKLPQSFQDELFQKIADIPEKTATTHIKTTREKWSFAVSLKKRLADPRVWTYPLLVLLVATALLFYDRSGNNSNDQNDQPVAFHQPEIDETKEENYVFHLPMSANTPVPDAKQPVLKFSTIEISCKLSTDAKKSQFMNRLFADHGIAFIVRENGVSTNTIYEVKVTREQLKTLLETMSNNKASVSEILVPYDFGSFLESVHTPDNHTPDIRHEVRFVVKNRR